MTFPWARFVLFGYLFVLPAALAWVGSPVTAGEEDTKLKVKEGQPAPDVDLEATQIDKVLPGQKDARTLHLSDLKGKRNVVLYFFPKALTGG